MGRYQSESRYSLHIQVAGIEPSIWRKIVVPGAISLHTLHKMLQVVMGWENAHLYLFQLTINKKTMLYGLPDPDWESADMHIRDSRRTKLDVTVWADWLKLTYEYDLGDSWMHQITIEKIEQLADDPVDGGCFLDHSSLSRRFTGLSPRGCWWDRRICFVPGGMAESNAS